MSQRSLSSYNCSRYYARSLVAHRDHQAGARAELINDRPEVLSLPPHASAAPLLAAAQSPLTSDVLLIEPANVLFDETATWRWLAQLLGRFQIYVPFEAFYCLWRHDYLSRVVPSACSRREALNHYLAEMGLTEGQRREVLAAFLSRWQSLLRHPRPLPGTLSALNQLKLAGLRLVVWDRNGLDRDGLATQLAALGIGSLVEVIHGDVAQGPLSEETLHAALSQIGATASDVAIVTCDCWTTLLARPLGVDCVVCNDLPAHPQTRHIARLEQLPGLFAGKKLSAKAA